MSSVFSIYNIYFAEELSLREKEADPYYVTIFSSLLSSLQTVNSQAIVSKVKMEKCALYGYRKGAEKLSEFSERFLRKFRKTPGVSAELLKSFSLHFL